jgi:hypothetical protein
VPSGVGISLDGARLIQFGKTGFADIMGLLGPDGRFLAIECKTGASTLSPEQRAFRSMIEDYGGLYVVARDLESVTAQIHQLQIPVTDQSENIVADWLAHLAG